MLVSDAAYASLAPGTPFVAPAHPGNLTIPAGATQYQIVHAKAQYKEDIRVFRNFSLMQRTLIQKIVSAVDTKYLSALPE